MSYYDEIKSELTQDFRRASVKEALLRKACAEVDRLREELAEARKDSERVDKLQEYLSDHIKNLSGPFKEDTSWQFGYNGGLAYVIEGSGDTLREAIDSLPARAQSAAPEGGGT